MYFYFKLNYNKYVNLVKFYDHSSKKHSCTDVHRAAFWLGNLCYLAGLISDVPLLTHSSFRP